MAHTQPSLTHGASSDIIVALTEYRSDMLDDLRGLELPQGVQMGDQLMTSSLEDKWPVSTGSISYEETVADHPNLVEFGEKFFSLTTKEFSAGVIAKAATLRTTDWAAHGWGKFPEENAEAFMYKLEELLAAVLEDGTTATSWMRSAKKVFDTGKPCDPSKPNNGHTVDNLHTSTALTVDNVAAMRTYLRTQKNAAGRPSGKRLTHIVCGADKEDALLQIVKDPTIVATYGSSTTQSATMINNKVAMHYPGIVPVILPTLTDSGVWYPVASRNGRMPWLTLLKMFARNIAGPAGMPQIGIQAADGLEWIMLDETSDHYKIGSKYGPKGTVAQWSQARMGGAITRELDIHRCEP